MKSFKKGWALLVVVCSFVLTNCEAQISNAKTETVKIYGNCGMCKKTIEKAGNQTTISSVVWNTESKVATVTYDPKLTSLDQVLERVAKSGYDSEKFRSTAKAYNALPGCCQYDRPE